MATAQLGSIDLAVYLTSSLTLFYCTNSFITLNIIVCTSLLLTLLEFSPMDFMPIVWMLIGIDFYFFNPFSRE